MKTSFLILFLILTILISFSSCRLTEKNITGIYNPEGCPKTTIKINADRTFEFSKNINNPYLYSADHPDEFYFDTKGTWQRLDKKNISLTSQSDSLIYPLVSIQTYPSRDKRWSSFTFYDTYGDTVQLLYVQFTDKSIAAAMDRSMNYFNEDLTERDTFEFHFYGYRPYKFISGQKINQDYKITLKPSFQPNFFIGTKFRIKRKQIIEVKRKYKFKKTKN